jgi:glycosyltransferase involved in cell wall biosynthesis
MSGVSNPAQIRVGVVSTSFPVPTNPGSGVFVQRLVDHLPEHVRPIVLIPCPTRRLPSLKTEKFELRCFAYGPRSMLRLAHQPGGVPDALRRRDFSLILLPVFVLAMFIACIRLATKVDVMHGNWSGPGLIAAIAARICNQPAVVTLRGSDVNRATHSRVLRLILRACITVNVKTVVVSERILSDLRECFPSLADRIVFIPNGVSTEPKAARLGFHDPVRLITVSNLIHSKRTEDLLHSLVAPGARSNVILRIIGDGPERKRLGALVEKLGLTERVEFMGKLPPGEINSHLAWADIFVFASESEGRPNVILEAMAAELPVVAADIPGTRELLLDCGVLVPPRDPRALADAVTSLIDDPSSALEIGRKAKDSVEARNLTWEQAGARYGALYREVARK